jgi:hypothetical protein
VPRRDAASNVQNARRCSGAVGVGRNSQRRRTPRDSLPPLAGGWLTRAAHANDVHTPNGTMRVTLDAASAMQVPEHRRVQLAGVRRERYDRSCAVFHPTAVPSIGPWSHRYRLSTTIRWLASGSDSCSRPGQSVYAPAGDGRAVRDSAELADELVELGVNGPKRATAGALIDYELEGGPATTARDDLDRHGWYRPGPCRPAHNRGPDRSTHISGWTVCVGRRRGPTHTRMVARRAPGVLSPIPTHDRRRLRSRCGHGVRAVRHAVRGGTPRTCSTTSERSSDLETVRHVPAAPGHAEAPIWGGLASPSLVPGVTVWVACDPRVHSEGHAVACRVFRQGPSTSR